MIGSVDLGRRATDRVDEQPGRAGPDWKNDPADTLNRWPATSSYSAALAPVFTVSGSPFTSPVRLSHIAVI